MTPVLRASNLSKRFRKTSALDGVYLDILPGEVVALIGRSGCGKSTLLRCISWLDEPDEGLVELEGKPFGREVTAGGVVRRHSPRQVAAMRPRLGFVFQALNLWPHMTALENVVRGQVVVLGRGRAAAEAKAVALLERLGLGRLLARHPQELSGGERQRVAIARALAMDPALLLFDEPTSALDPETVGEVLALLRGLAEGGMTMLVVTHEIGFAARVADRVAFMDHGRIIEEGPAAQVLSNPREPRFASFLDQVLHNRDPNGDT
ncbi:MAG: amino acid ABC transporter ATP-binding protein [Roseococcus sp.]|nr:amino acid ABC transporter ATP-binding protein [Roseococcus sp.]